LISDYKNWCLENPELWLWDEWARSWGYSLDETHGMGELGFGTDRGGEGLKHPLTPEAPDFSRGAAHI
jgi:hypothetical protein